MRSGTRQRLALALVALAVLAACIALCAGLRDHAHLGMVYEANTNRVLLVERDSAADVAGLRPGDTVVAIGMQPPGSAATAIGGLLPVSVRQGAVLGVRWLAQPAAGPTWPLVLLLVTAAALWLAGLLVGVAGPARPSAYLFALFALLAALALCCAAVQDPPDQTARWLLAPSAFGALLCYTWLQRPLAGMGLPAWGSRFDWVLAGQAVLVVVALELGPRLFGIGSGRGLAILAALDMPLLLLAAHILPLWRFDPAAPAPLRRRARLALLVGLVGWLPALALGWAPVLAGLIGPGYVSPIPPYTGALSLIVLAVTYPAIVARGDLFALEAAVRRLAVSLVLGGVLLALIAAIVHGLDLAFHPAPDTRLILGLVLGLLALPVFEPARRRLQNTLERRLAVDRIDYSTALEATSDELLRAFDEEAIAAALTTFAPPLLGLSSLRPWLLGSGGRWLHFAGNEREQHTLDSFPLLASSGSRALIPLVAGSPAPNGAGSELLMALLHSDQPFTPPPSTLPPGTALCVPVHIGEELRGMLLLGPRRSQDPYRGPERDALLLLARQVAAALQLVDRVTELRARNAELAQLTSRLARAREEERKHLSHELHDAVAQDLMAITRQLHRRQQGTLPDAIWQDMIAQSQEALAAIRRICNDLRPAILDMGLASALRELVDRAPRGLRVHLEIRGAEQRLDEEREFALYRVSQEALANVIKHAEATEVTITVHFDAALTEVAVRDNGRGFLVPARLEEIGGDHLGLLGMRERLAGLGGMVRVESAPGEGACVCAEIPS